MSGRKKVSILIAALVLLIAGLWIYWEREIPLTDLLPDAAWTRVRLLAGDADSAQREREIAPPPLETILEAISATKVTRGEKNPHLDDKYFQLYLYPEEGYPTVIYVKSNGGIMAAADMDLDHYQYYEDGEALYQALLEISGEGNSTLYKPVYSAETGSI